MLQMLILIFCVRKFVLACVCVLFKLCLLLLATTVQLHVF